MSSRITRINKSQPLSHSISKEIMAAGDSLTAASYMKSPGAVSPIQQLNRWPDLVANAIGSVFNEALCGDGWALCNSYLAVGSKDHTVASGDYGGQIIVSTNNSQDYWWDSDTSTWKIIGGATISSVNASAAWTSMLSDADVNIVILSHTGINDYGEWSSRQSLADGAFSSPKMFYQRMKQMIVELLNAGKTPFIITGMTAFDSTFHGKVSDYFKTGTYAAKARQLAVEYNIPWADCSARLAIEAALGRPDFNARVATVKPDQYTVGEWTTIVNATPNPETGVNYLYPFTDSYRDTNGNVMVDETFDDYHDGTIGTADSTRAFWQNQHLNFWGQKIVADEVLNIIEEYGFKLP